MPRKPKNTKRKRRFRRRKGKVDKTGVRHDTVLYHARGQQHSPLPAVYLAKFVASGSCYTASGAGTGDVRLNIRMNSLYRPFASAVTGVTYNDITAATYNATGYSTLVSATMYTTFLVYAAKIEFDVVSQSLLDPIMVTITASNAIDTPSTSGAAQGQGWTKQQMFQNGRMSQLGDYPMKLFCPCYRLIGVDKRIWMNDIGANFAGGINSTPPVLLWFVVNISTPDNTVFDQPVSLRFRVTYYAKLRELNYESMQN